MRYIALCLFGWCLTLCGGCSPHKTIGPGDPVPIPFDLIVPQNIPSATFYGFSGLSIKAEKIQVADTIVDGFVTGYYGQFLTIGTAVPASVTLNNKTLVRNLGSDTLRLASGALTNFGGTQTWTLTDSGGTPQNFVIAAVEAVDSVGPFLSTTTVRGDTALQVTWQPSLDGSDIMSIVWSAPNLTTPYVQDVNDGPGSFFIPRSVMTTLVGKGTVTFVRYRTARGTFRGKDVVLVRIAQRQFTVTVLP